MCDKELMQIFLMSGKPTLQALPPQNKFGSTGTLLYSLSGELEPSVFYDIFIFEFYSIDDCVWLFVQLVGIASDHAFSN